MLDHFGGPSLFFPPFSPLFLFFSCASSLRKPMHDRSASGKTGWHRKEKIFRRVGEDTGVLERLFFLLLSSPPPPSFFPPSPPVPRRRPSNENVRPNTVKYMSQIGHVSSSTGVSKAGSILPSPPPLLLFLLASSSVQAIPIRASGRLEKRGALTGSSAARGLRHVREADRYNPSRGEALPPSPLLSPFFRPQPHRGWRSRYSRVLKTQLWIDSSDTGRATRSAALYKMKGMSSPLSFLFSSSSSLANQPIGLLEFAILITGRE